MYEMRMEKHVMGLACKDLSRCIDEIYNNASDGNCPDERLTSRRVFNKLVRVLGIGLVLGHAGTGCHKLKIKEKIKIALIDLILRV